MPWINAFYLSAMASRSCFPPRKRGFMLLIGNHMNYPLICILQIMLENESYLKPPVLAQKTNLFRVNVQQGLTCKWKADQVFKLPSIGKTLVCRALPSAVILMILWWWCTYPSEKWWSSSVGIKWFPIPNWMEKYNMFQTTISHFWFEFWFGIDPQTITRSLPHACTSETVG